MSDPCFSDIDLGEQPERVLRHVAKDRRTQAQILKAIDDEDLLRGIVASHDELQRQLGDMPNSKVLESLPNATTRWLMSQASVLRWAGPKGNWLADRIVASRRISEQLQARYKAAISEIFSPLSDGERSTVWRYLELGEDHGPKVKEAADRALRVHRQLYTRLGREGVELATDLADRYFPHTGFDFDALAQEGSLARKEAVDHLMEFGTKNGSTFSGRSEAESFLDIWMRKSSARRMRVDSIFQGETAKSRQAGTFEAERQGFPGWTKDPVAAFTISLNDGARRLGETLTLGKNGEKALKAISLLREQGSGPVADWGHYLLTQTMGTAQRTGIQNEFLGAIHDLGLSRLTMTWLSALTEIPKVYVKAGIKPFFHGLADFFANPLEASRKAAWLGATLDQHILVQSAGGVSAIERSVADDIARRAPTTLVGKGIRKVGESIARMSSAVDNLTRSIAVGAGESLFRDLTRIVREKGIADDYVKARLKEFSISPALFQDAVLSNNEQLLERLNNSLVKDLADQTVFTHRPSDRPQIFQSEMGRLVGQFHQFATKQGEFSLGELTAWFRGGKGNKAAQQRTMRMLSLLILGNPTMALGVSAVKDWLSGDEGMTWERMNEFMRDPSFTNFATFTAASNATLGTLGTVSDIASMVARGDRFNMRSFGRPAAFGAFDDVIAIAQGLKKGVVDDDSEGFDDATVNAGRLFGQAGEAAAVSLTGQ